MAVKVDLHDCRTYGGQTYGPGAGVKIPKEMKEALDELDYFERSSEEQESGGLFEGLTDEQVENLREAGFGNEAAIAEADLSDLIDVDQVGEVTAQKLKERAGNG